MSTVERVRERISDGPLSEQVGTREQAGWTLVALEWQRSEVGAGRDSVLQRTEVPYGLRVARDFLHLEENPVEVEAMILMLDWLIDDRPLQEVADELNRRGMRTRQGREWTASSVFDRVPRLVEVGPDIFGSGSWSELREKRKSRRPVAV